MKFFVEKFFQKVQLVALSIISVFFLVSPALAATSTQSVNVGLTVPNVSTTSTCVGVCGGGGGPSSPQIINVVVSSTPTTANITWNVTASAAINTVSFVYGLDVSYPLTGTVTGNYATTLTGLTPNTTYYYKISATDASAQTGTNVSFFVTPNNVPPGNVAPIISNVTFTVGQTSTTIRWDTNIPADSQITYGLTAGYGEVAFDGALKTQHVLTLTGLTLSTQYHFSIIATANGLSSATNDAVFTTLGNGQPPATEICGNAIDDDGNGNIDCADAACVATPACQNVQPSNEICANGVDDNNDGKTDCLDPQCSATPACQIINIPGEVCGNGIDDDNNGRVDCADGACVGFAGCSAGNTTTIVTPPVTVSGGGRLSVQQLTFLGGARNFPLAVNGGKVTALAGDTITVGVLNTELHQPVATVYVKIAGLSYQIGAGADGYLADIPVGLPGTYEGFVQIEYTSLERDVIKFLVQSVPFGNVMSGTTRVSGAIVTLTDSSGDTAVTYDHPNPFMTNENGIYGWMVPNGKYSLRVTSPGYYSYSLSSFSVTNNVINNSITLVATPPDILKGITATTTIANAVKKISTNILLNTKALTDLGIQTIDALRQNTDVQNVAGSVVAPTVVGVAALSAAAFISWANLLPFLRLLFLQPLLLMGLRRRRGWGQVYNSLNKLPVDLVTIRLINIENGKVVQTKVTDHEGRYAFIAQPGQYRLEVIKNGFTFPSSLLAGFKDDGRRTDIYHGEPIVVSDKDAIVAANIPLDPLGETKKPPRIFWQRLGRFLQLLLSWSGLIITGISFYFSPHWYVAALLVAHLFVFFVFRRLAIPPKIKSWGIVYDSRTKAPVGRAVARLFSEQFNKLVGTQVTDRKGRYFFLAGDGRYYVTYDHEEYEPHKTSIIDLSGKEADTIAKDIGLQTKSEPSPGSTVTQYSPSKIEEMPKKTTDQEQK